jgi:hypothetical protein
MSEVTPLLQPAPAPAPPAKYYFLNKGEGGTTQDSVRVVEGLPEGAEEEEFAPRVLEPLRVSLLLIENPMLHVNKGNIHLFVERPCIYLLTLLRLLYT